VGSGEKYPAGLVDHYPGLCVDGRVKLLFGSKDSLLRPERIGERVAGNV
jgi:hypothetical protein